MIKENIAEWIRGRRARKYDRSDSGSNGIVSRARSVDWRGLYGRYGNVRALSLVAFGLLAIAVTWSGIKAISTNYQLQEQISELARENQDIALEVENQKLRNEYYKTDQYTEIAARKQLGMADKGETVLLVPRDVALSYAPEIDDSQEEPEIARVERPFYSQNFRDWLDFILGRNRIN